MSSTEIFAEPMLDSDEYLEKFKKQVNELKRKGLLQKFDATLTYKVYSIHGSDFGTHKSIVLTTDDKHFITVELGFTVVNGKKHIYPITRELHPSNEPKLEYLGTIDAKGQNLLAKAVDVMKRFGNYFKFCKNCQNFCDKYVEAIGLKKAKSLTDDGMSAIAAIPAIITGILVFFLFLFALAKSLIRNERRKTQ